MKLFITGTDTGVGKTWVSGAILSQATQAGLSATYYKPIQTGSPQPQPPEDPAWIDITQLGKVKTFCRYCFDPPVTPAVADPNETIDCQQIKRDVHELSQTCDLLLTEGAGGLMVPISKQILMIDLIEQLKIPTLLVARSQLGTLNHTLLSVEALQKRQIPLLGIVFNFYPSQPEESDLAVQTLIPTIQPHLSPDTSIWTCQMDTEAATPQFSTTFSLSTYFQCNAL